MREPITISIIIHEDLQPDLRVMAMLDHVMQYMEIDQDSRIRIAEWFREKYSYRIKVVE